ncbi:hypothetical protein [Amorphus sp. 3PC139-8]|uniref:hypothetical protein n=1 Tax=Amorphus sp. 3PC139-8 TaxID=2735676 RepID=UPI00345DC568
MVESILFLDLATRMGWCEGKPGGAPKWGAEFFAEEGSDNPAVFAGAFRWVVKRLEASPRPRTIVYEAPLDPRHMGQRTTRATGLRLIGLPACVEAAAYLMRLYDVQEARADDIRRFVLGRRAKKAEAKPLVIRAVTNLGFPTNDPDAADAIAGWLYACHLADPENAHDVAPLFAAARNGKRT